MLVSVPTLLSRASRRRTAVPFCSVTSAEVLLAVSSALEKAGADGVLSVPAKKRPEGKELPLLALAHWLAQHNQVDLGVQLDLTCADPEAWQPELGALHGFARLAVMTAGTPSRWQIPAEWSRLDRLGTFTESVELSHHPSHVFQALAISPPSGKDGTAAWVEHRRRQAKVPLLVEEGELSPASLRRCVKAGIAGVLFERRIDEAFTAGLRTGLRNRSATDPSRYFAPATAAVSDRLANYLTCLT